VFCAIKESLQNTESGAETERCEEATNGEGEVDLTVLRKADGECAGAVDDAFRVDWITMGCSRGQDCMSWRMRRRSRLALYVEPGDPKCKSDADDGYSHSSAIRPTVRH